MNGRTRRLAACTAALLALVGAWWAQGSHGEVAPPSGEVAFQPVLGAPVADLHLIAAARQGEPGETWGWGSTGGGTQLVRYTRAAGAWQVVPVTGPQGAALGATPAAATASVSDRGAVALLARAPDGGGNADDGRLALRPAVGGSAFALAPPPATGGESGDGDAARPADSGTPAAEPADGDGAAAGGDAAEGEASEATAAAGDEPAAEGAAPVLAAGERLLAPGGAGSGGSGPAVAATDERDGPGALVLPWRPDGGSAAPAGVLHWDGAAWTREAVCSDTAGPDGCTPSAGLTAPRLAVAPGGGAWLLATVAGKPQLFQRTGSGDDPVRWLRRLPQSWLLGGGPPPAAGIAVAARKLTVTDRGAWVDLQASGAASASASVLVAAADPGGAPLGVWCQPAAACPGATGSLGAALPADDYGSAAFDGEGAGTRVIAGLPNGGLLRLAGGGDFAYGVGGGAGGQTAAFSTPDDGWLSIANAPQLTRVAPTAEPSRLTAWPVPFRYPLLALATAPGATPGASGAAALAVGDRGQIARYAPGSGWSPEYLYGTSGSRATPRLRGVAWPEPGRAYAVGDEGSMWLWRVETGLWEPDPARPLNFHGQLAGIAFDPADAGRGYAVGKQGVLLAYGRTWTQEPLPPGIEDEHFTSVAFAGRQALATYRNGLLVDDGSGWRVDEGVARLLGDATLSRVAGLPDGGAVVAGAGIVLERDGPSAPWRPSTQPIPYQSAYNVSALAAFRDGSSVRALVSVDTSQWSYPKGSVYQEIDDPPPSAPGQPPVFLDPDPLPVSGYLLRETAGGWHDEQHAAFSDRIAVGAVDGPAWPDAVLALAVDPAGGQGWAVGGDTGGRMRLGDPSDVQTAGVQRYGDGPAPPVGATAPVGGIEGKATFALGGAAQCARPCADFANQGLGPDRWLRSAVVRAGQIPGLRAFLYAGPRLAPSVRAAGGEVLGRELARYAAVLRGGAGALPAYAAISRPEAAADGATAPFAAALGAAAPAGSVPSGTPAPPPGTAAYAVDSSGDGGGVRLIVLDFSAGALAPGRSATACPGDPQAPADQLDWLCAQLDAARAAQRPAIVLGSADLRDLQATPDGAAVAAALAAHGASAYLFSSAERNVQFAFGTAPRTVPAFGSGTLGYVASPVRGRNDFLGESGFLLLSVDAAARDAATNVAPVTASLVPNAGQLAIDATDGVLLRRSAPALFSALARRPAGGSRLMGSGNTTVQDPNPYVPIPNPCVGTACGERVATAYRFSSSEPDIGDFVARDPDSTDPRAVLQGADGKPIADPGSGLFCAFNAGTTVVSVTTGGLTYSQRVTVQRGSVRQPCGTTPLRNPPPAATPRTVEDDVPPLEDPGEQEPEGDPTPVAVGVAPPAPPAQTPPAPHQPAARPPLPPAAIAAPLAALVPVPVRGAVPPPPPSPARPTPPSGTSQVQAQSPVSQPASAPERQREEEVATELMHNMAAYEPPRRHEPPTAQLAVALLVLGAAAGATVRRDRRRLRHERARALARAGAGDTTRTLNSHVDDDFFD